MMLDMLYVTIMGLWVIWITLTVLYHRHRFNLNDLRREYILSLAQDHLDEAQTRLSDFDMEEE